MESKEENDIKRSQAIYTESILNFYDLFVLGFSCRFVWKCPSYHILELYHQNVSANHLDVGVGTGYFLDNCRFPVDHPRLALMDLNSNSLEKSRKRLERYDPEVYRRNILELDKVTLPNFDSIALTNLIHCLPGTMKTKGILFDNVRRLLNPGGVVFGTTILWKGVENSLLATYYMNVYNAMGVMTNKQDDLDSLKQNLEKRFSESSLRTIGSMALFWARK